MSRKTSQIYVSRFSRSTTEDDLQDHFKGCGKIKEISMKNGYAFVEFSDYRDAEDAVEKMDGKSLDGHKLIVEMAGANKRKSSRREGGSRGPQPNDKCFNCGRMGHWANECRESKSRRKRYSSSRSRSESSSSKSKSKSRSRSRSSSSSRDRRRRKTSRKHNRRERSKSSRSSPSRSRRNDSRSRSKESNGSRKDKNKNGEKIQVEGNGNEGEKKE